MDPRLKELRARKEQAVHAGSEDAVSRQHARGKMTARERVEALLDPGSFVELDLLARHRAVLPSWMPLYYDEPIELVSGSGRRVTDARGRTYLDFFGGVLTTMLGYDLPEIREAVERQLREEIVSGALPAGSMFAR